MKTLLFATLVVCGILIPIISSMPTSKTSEVDADRIVRISEKAPIRKRSTNADIGLNGSRMANMNEILRRYMLLTILDNVKGKRSWKRREDGSLDYEHIAGVILRHSAGKHPWYVVDMKRDIHPDPDPESVMNRLAEMAESESRMASESDDEERSVLDSYELSPSAVDRNLNVGERPEDQSNDNARINLLDLFSS